jgi:photosystem II stability/assembly factor-like uncharacterized protein
MQLLLRAYLPAVRRAFFLVFGLGVAWDAVGQASYDTRSGQALPGLPFWKWQSPAPQGYILNDLYAFTDSAALLIGNHGTALRTADQGRSWSPVSVGTDRDLVSLSFATPQTGWVAYSTPATDRNTQDGGVGPGEVRRTTDGGLTWTRQLIGEAFSVRMRKVMALSATTVYAFYDWGRRLPIGVYTGFAPRLRRSQNGGQTWTNIPLPFSSIYSPTNDLVFPTATTGFAGGGEVNGSGWVQRTTDGGTTWTPLVADAGRLVPRSLFFLDAQHGWVAGKRTTSGGVGPLILRTIDGGQTWTPLPIPPVAAVAVIRFAPDGLHGVLHDGLFTTLRTADGGQTWGGRQYGTTTYGLSRPPIAQLRASGTTWLQTGDTKLLVAAAFDSLRVAYQPRTLVEERLGDVAFSDATHGWATSAGTFFNFPGFPSWNYRGQHVVRTSDRGDHWQVLALDTLAAGLVNWGAGYDTFLTSGAFPDRDTAYLAGSENFGQPAQSGFLLRTTDGGTTWTRLTLPGGAATPFQVRFVNGQRGLVVGDAGLLAVTHDAGQTWQSVVATSQRLRTAGWIDPQHAYVAGDSAVIGHSTDGGRSWQMMRMDSIGVVGTGSPYSSGHTFAFDNITFLTPTLGFNVGANTPMRTTNGGRTWRYDPFGPDLYLQGGRTSELRQIVFRTPLEGYAFGDDQFRTLDGGLTWTVWAQTTAGTVAGAVLDKYNAFTVGYGGTILRYSEKFIQTDTALARTSFCLGAGVGDSLAVPFTLAGTFSTAEQHFRVELSNARGRFRPGQTLLVGQGTTSPILARLPANLPTGTYRLRVIRADSTVLGSDNGTDLLIYARPSAVAILPTDSTRICQGDSVQLIAPAGYRQYRWSTGAGTASIWVSTATAPTVQVAQGGNCFSPASAAVTVRVTPRPAAPTVSQQATGGSVTLTSSAASGNQWYLNGVAIPGATGAAYTVATPGTSGPYTVRVTDRGCEGPASTPENVTVITGLATESTAGELRLVPNPATDAVRLTLTRGQLVQCQVTDLTGRLVVQVRAQTSDYLLSLTGVPAGTYLVRVGCADGRERIHRLVVAH